jgi:cytochrome c biogenesis protein CcdA
LAQTPDAYSETVSTRLGGAFGNGLLLSLIMGPCGTPVLASVLSYAAYKQNFIYGGLLLFLYGVGNGLLVVLVGTAAGGLPKKFVKTDFRGAMEGYAVFLPLRLLRVDAAWPRLARSLGLMRRYRAKR